MRNLAHYGENARNGVYTAKCLSSAKRAKSSSRGKWRLPNELPTRDAPVEQLMYLSFQTEAEIAAVVGQPVLDLNKRAFFATGQLTFALAWRRSARFFRAHPQCSAALMMELLRQMREIWRHS